MNCIINLINEQIVACYLKSFDISVFLIRQTFFILVEISIHAQMLHKKVNHYIYKASKNKQKSSIYLNCRDERDQKQYRSCTVGPRASNVENHWYGPYD
jgi:hypothetical protein